MHTYPDTGSIFNPYGTHDMLAQSQDRIQQSTPIAILNTFQKEKQFPVLCVPNEKMRSCNINCVPSGNPGSKTEVSQFLVLPPSPLPLPLPSFCQLKTKQNKATICKSKRLSSITNSEINISHQ